MPETLDPPTRRQRAVAFLGLARHHPGVTLLWVGTFALLVAGTIQRDNHMGRWAIWLAIICAVCTLSRVGKWVVARTAHIYAVFHDDVRLHEQHDQVTALRTGRRRSH